jgi:hypothetical protein
MIYLAHAIGSIALAAGRIECNLTVILAVDVAADGR